VISPCSGRLTRAALALGALALLAACSEKVIAPPEPPAAVRRGDEAFRFEEYPKAIDAYRSYLDQVERGDYTPRTFYKQAVAEYRLGRYDDTLATLDELAQRYPKTHWVQADALRGDTHLALGHQVEALKAWDTAWRSANDAEREKLRERIMRLARGLDDVQLAEGRRAVHNKDVGRILDRQIAQRQPADMTEPPGAAHVAMAPEPETPPIITEPLENAAAHHAPAAPEPAPAAAVQPEPAAPPRPSVAERFEAEEATQPSQPAAAAKGAVAPPAAEQPVAGTVKVGCLLPLSGASSDFGKASLRGLQLIFGDRDEHLVVRDTGSDPQTAARMFNELAADPSVLIIIGPLRGDAAELVAPRAEQAHVPLFLLSQRDGLAHRYVIQLGMTRGSQVGALLGYAMDKVRLKRFGVVYPKDAYGNDFVATFRNEVQRRGGTVVGTEAYAPDQRNVSTDVDAVKKWRRAQNVQAVFLPDSATAAAEFATALQKELPDVTLLGVHGWEQLAVRKEAAPLNGMLFSDGFYAGSARPGTRDFVERFKQAYGEAPTALEAQAYDAGLLARRTIGAGASTRAGVLQQIDSMQPLDGATGELRMTPAGLERDLFLLQVYDGKVQEIAADAG